MWWTKNLPCLCQPQAANLKQILFEDLLSPCSQDCQACFLARVWWRVTGNVGSGGFARGRVLRQNPCRPTMSHRLRYFVAWEASFVVFCTWNMTNPLSRLFGSLCHVAMHLPTTAVTLRQNLFEVQLSGHRTQRGSL